VLGRGGGIIYSSAGKGEAVSRKKIDFLPHKNNRCPIYLVGA